ncbi:putative Arsenite resistance protein ArsB [Glarea lozoyensis 74030]|uniref:Putative Arsenite resistance protein ArsB n=1 Tax=Glarea lozoyensis (strain ATCC 74030 / MF5533) TaxID=1104152 RepID=H0EE26_GLAL7|nr:putative Arsenite resistance protein ArsB [Glarea lozoyensis 74030]
MSSPLHNPQTPTPESKEHTLSSQPPPNSTVLDIEQQEKAGSKDTASSPTDSVFKGLALLDRFLALWIFLAMAIGIILGNFVPNTGPALQKGKFVGVSVPIVRYETLHRVFRDRKIWVQIGFSVIVNWIVAPLLMLALSWAFLPDKPALREGLILVGLARCIAMVLIWTNLANGDNEYCAILVAINSVLQMVLFAPLAILFLRVISGAKGDDVSYEVVAQLLDQ